MTLDHPANCPCPACCAQFGPVGGLTEPLMLQIAKEILNETTEEKNEPTTTETRR